MRFVRLLFALFFSLLFMTSVAAQETKLSLTIQPVSSITSGGETIFPVESESHQFEAGEGGTFDFASPGGGSVKIVFFIGTTQVALDFFIDSYEQSAVIAARPLPVGRSVVGSFVYDMKTFEGVAETLAFDAPFSMTVGYLDSQIENLDEETLNIYFWNETQNTWETFASSTLNTADNTITIFTDHLTLFATLGEEKEESSTAEVASPSVTVGGGGGGGGGGLARRSFSEGGGIIFQPEKEEPVTTAETLEENLAEKEPEIEEVPTSKELTIISPLKNKRQVSIPSTSGGVTPIVEHSSLRGTAGQAKQILQESILPALFDIKIQPETEGEPRQWKSLLIVITGIAMVIGVLAVYIFRKRKFSHHV